MLTKGGKTPYVPTDELGRMGYDIIIFASDVQRAAIFGMRRLLQELRETRTGEFFAETVGFQEREVLSMQTTISNFRNAICVWIN